MSHAQTAFRLVRSRRVVAWVASAVVAAVVVLAAFASGAIDSASKTLVFMGFDADRARLITALLVGGVAGASAALATNRTGPATVAGLGGFAALFGGTFISQTRGALNSNGTNGFFDLNQWALTLLALVMSGVISSWAGATLAVAVRPRLTEAGRLVLDAVRTRRLDSAHLRLPMGVLLVLVLLLVSVPVFGDMVNYTTDARMLHGAPPRLGLVHEAAPPNGGLVTPGPLPSRSSRPSEGGLVYTADLPAPWNNTSSATERVDIYLPPGYDPNGQKRYPVLYEAPFPYDLWDSSVNIGVVLNTLIDSGAVPPMIVAFVNDYNALILDTECANSTDGSQWMDTFISSTVVSYMDSNYMTIAKASARAVTGFSEGGYCAAILALRHPAVFGTAIPFSAYYFAGEGNASAGLPFGGDQAALSAASPMILAAKLTPAERAELYFIVVAQPSQPLYGYEATAFERLLYTEGYQFVSLNAALPHGWDQVRQELPGALEAWAARLTAAGVSVEP
ncbi:MAG TPA: alpha/beta hydrolase-fold protein [Candidatus Limnocylindrales bacterium]